MSEKVRVLPQRSGEGLIGADTFQLFKPQARVEEGVVVNFFTKAVADAKTHRARKSSPLERLTRIERYQVLKPERGATEAGLSSVSETITSNPQIQRSIIPNPYSPEALRLSAERFPEMEHAQVVKGVIIAEPEGQYERDFSQLSRVQRRAALYEQIDISAEMTRRLKKYGEEHGQEFWGWTKEQLHERLSAVAFGTADTDVIEKKFAQSQRRGFRLAAVHLIEDMQMLRPYKNSFTKDPKSNLGRTVQRDFHGNVDLEVLPIGFAVDFDKVDYRMLDHDGGNQEYVSVGSILRLDCLPSTLQRRIVAII